MARHGEVDAKDAEVTKSTTSTSTESGWPRG